jgi:hypothetical protein
MHSEIHGIAFDTRTSTDELMNRSGTKVRHEDPSSKTELPSENGLTNSNEQLQLLIMVLGLLVAILELLSTLGIL